MNKLSSKDAKVEAAYIASVNPVAPGELFNNNRACFARYCKMQAAELRHSGFHFAAQDIQQAQFIADPDTWEGTIKECNPS